MLRARSNVNIFFYIERPSRPQDGPTTELVKLTKGGGGPTKSYIGAPAPQPPYPPTKSYIGAPAPQPPYPPQSFYDAIRDKAANLRKIAPEPSDLR